MKWICQQCHQQMAESSKARHLVKYHPQIKKDVIASEIKGDALCPECNKIMLKNNMSRHMKTHHPLFKKQNKTVKDRNKEIIASGRDNTKYQKERQNHTPRNWVCLFLLLEGLWNNKKYVQESDIWSAAFECKIIWYQLGLQLMRQPIKDYIDCLEVYQFVTRQKHAFYTPVNGIRSSLIIFHIAKGPMHAHLMQQVRQSPQYHKIWLQILRYKFEFIEKLPSWVKRVDIQESHLKQQVGPVQGIIRKVSLAILTPEVPKEDIQKALSFQRYLKKCEEDRKIAEQKEKEALKEYEDEHGEESGSQESA